MRRLPVVSQVASILFSAVSWSQSTQFLAVIPAIDSLQAIIALLTIAAWKRHRRATV